MKRALSVTAVTALSLLVFLFIGNAQEEGAPAVSELLEQELASMEAAFGGLTAFMAELIGEVKGNMADINDLNAIATNHKNTLAAISAELKTAEGKIIGLRGDVNALGKTQDALGKTQQELKVRVVALEAGLSELSAFVDRLKSQLDTQGVDLGALRQEFDALATDYAAFYEDVYKEIDTLRDSVYGDIGALRDRVAADLSLLQTRVEDITGRVQALEDEDVGTFKKKVIDLERSLAALAIKIDNNRAKLEGFDHAFARLSDEITASREASARDLEEYSLRLTALEESTDIQEIQQQIDTLYFISIVALLAGVGALIWGFLGNNS